MQDESHTEILASVRAGMGRRAIGIGALCLLGGLLIYVAMSQPPALGWQIFLVAMGAGALWLADAMRRATNFCLELTLTELRDEAGIVLARVEDIEAIDRGAFAFKPSNGFLLRTRTAGARAWRPGLWWRIGRRIGVGGMAPARQTKQMSEIIAAMIAKRDLDIDQSV